MKDFAWSSGAQIVDYTVQLDKDGATQKLQGSLYLPANYEKGKTYPTIVYIYEKLTQGHNQLRRADGERLQQVRLHEQRLRRADAGHHLRAQRPGHVGGVVRHGRR